MSNQSSVQMFDFLYSDHERVAALISQIEGVGNPISYGRSSEKQKNDSTSVSGSVRIISGGKSVSTNWNKELRQEYDPLWSNSKRLVDLVGQDQPTDSLVEYEYGKILTVSGKLLCMDQGLFNNILKSPAIVNQITSGMDDPESSRSSKVKNKNKNELGEIIREFIQSLPLGVVFILFTARDAFWFNVKREYLQLQSLDIPLKFPVQIGGVWHVTGIVDSLPQDYADIADHISGFDEKRVVPGGFETIAQLITPLIGLFGRPADAYGLNPLTIHREIKL